MASLRYFPARNAQPKFRRSAKPIAWDLHAIECHVRHSRERGNPFFRALKWARFEVNMDPCVRRDDGVALGTFAGMTA